MRPPISGLLKLALLLPLTALATPLALHAQEDAPSLGDLARNLRKSKAQQPPQQAPDPLHPIIDNDNLTEAMEDVKNARPVKPNKTVFSVDAASNTLKVSSPDVTCNLSFNARAAALLIKPVLIEDLPLPELVKIDGPGTIQEENLQLEVFNGTDWDLREITVGLTLERKPGQNAALSTRARVIPAAQSMQLVPMERHSDLTLLYHLKAQAKPFSTTAFRENIGITPGPDEDWRWSIVEAKGIRPAQAPAQPDAVREEPLFAMPALLQPESNQQPAQSPANTSGKAADKGDAAPAFRKTEIQKPSLNEPAATTGEGPSKSNIAPDSPSN